MVTRSAARPRSRSLLPREHGVYAEVGFPLLTALALGAPNVASVLLSSAVIAAFLLHEPVAVLLGARGRRMKAELGASALRRGLLLSGVVLVCGALGAFLAPDQSRAALLLSLSLALLLVPVVVKRREKTTEGQVLVALACSSVLVPVATAAGVDLRFAITAAGVWAVTFVMATFAVRMILERTKGVRGPMRVMAPITAGLATGGALAAVGVMPAALAVLPVGLLTLALGWTKIQARRLRAVGWGLIACDVVTFAWLVGQA